MSNIGELLIRNEHEIPFARQLTQRLCLLAKLSIGDQARITTAVSQVAQCLFHHCRCVHLSLDVITEDGQHWLQATLVECSPAAGSGQTGQGSRLSRGDLLIWLDGIRNMVSAFSSESEGGLPVRVTLAKPFPSWQKSVSEQTLSEWTATLINELPKEPIEIIIQQNRELVTVLDALREKETALEKKIAEIEALERMRDDLAHALVHDLRNPLSSIRTSLSGLLHNNLSNLSRYQQMMVEISYLGAVKLTRLVDDILKVYRLEGEKLVVEPVRFSLAGLVDKLLQLQGPLLEEKNIRVAVEIPDEVPPVDGDKDLIERVFQNLLDNAIKFTPRGGTIAVLVEPQVDGALQFRKGKFVRFIGVRVRDSGPGVPDAVKTALFEKFSTAQVEESGSGLGLAFCKLAVQAHGGDIWMEGGPGEGAEFVFLLPAAREPAPGKDRMNV
ncbi:MAG TPA: sensor histidine kinase [Anaerolineales bacterium]|nr:sensor histidine kinase [Anaerolineales bacterium]